MSTTPSPLAKELGTRHAQVLAELAAEQDMSERNVLRAALRLYQMVHVRAKRGEQLAFTDAEGRLLPQHPLSKLRPVEPPTKDGRG